jgi:hypothetical protein
LLVADERERLLESNSEKKEMMSQKVGDGKRYQRECGGSERPSA